MKLGILILALTVLSSLQAEPLVLPVWPEGVPGALPGGGEEIVQNDRVSNVQVPTLTVFTPAPELANGTAVVICPGGGYSRLAVSVEGSPVAKWLNSLGVTCFVLKYRLKEYGHPAPLRDVLRAVRLVRSRATEFGVDPTRIGIYGASAGGHLASCAATLYDSPLGKTGAALDAVSARPDFAILQYPVIQMEGDAVHAGSRTCLLGSNPSPENLALLSTDRQVTKDTPPVFIFSALRDKTVPMENSLAFFTALRRAGVDGELHIYEKGAHGFGLRQDLGSTSDWTDQCEAWMNNHHWLEKKR